ncbi:Mu transposase C-terminal domain-containing protein [Mycobacterium avium]|uniref:Mu transposase C-terminal domain-containing protein n=1 Tax=Mycobacterium avium TaxID=1764 RepID=UPI001CC3A738|nr:Mu transposase C-terminal domain-containing protein [Mycobacterium avium]
MTSARTVLVDGARLLTDFGTAQVVSLDEGGLGLRYSWGEATTISWAELGTLRSIEDGFPEALCQPMQAVWDGLGEAIRSAALTRLEIVQEILTGYRDGHPAFARQGEPRSPFGPGFGISEHKRCIAMAKQLNLEAKFDRDLQRRVANGDLKSGGVSDQTIRRWVREFKRNGLLALIDGRAVRARNSYDRIDQHYQDAAIKVLDSLDGDRSTISIEEIKRQTEVDLKKSGLAYIEPPERITRQYLSSLKRERGYTTRAQRSRRLRHVSGTKHYPAIRPGQVVAIDATRADNLVYDPYTGKPYSVEILTAIDVATRVVLAIRVVARSANGIEAGLLVYDICRPFSMVVDGTSIGHWRWVGLPEQLDFTHVPVRAGRRLFAPDFSTLQGEHRIPSVLPDAIRSDHGAIFVSKHFRALLDSMGIDLLLNRGGKANDNPHVERWHETVQRALQQIPGYKGRNTSERGRLVSMEPMLTATELEQHLRRFIALDYHRTGHSGIIQPGQEDARVCPLEMWDAMVSMTGRIDVPQRPDLIYQFLPVHWATIGHDGVELKNLIYDSPVLGDYRSKRVGRFRPQDDRAPFFVDPRDLSRIWFQDLATERKLVYPIEWRGVDRTQAPMAKAIVDHVCQRIRERGGNNVLHRNSATRQIIDELTQITEAPIGPRLRRKLTASRLRVEQARVDHAEAQAAQKRLHPSPPPGPRPSGRNQQWPNLLDEEA